MNDENLSSSDEHQELGALRRQDFVLGFVVWCISLATLIESWRLTFTLELPGVDAEKAWLVAPGIFPLVLSAGLLLMFSIVLIASAKEGKFKGHFGSTAMAAFLSDGENVRQLIQIALLLIYVFILLGRLHFGVASALYLFAAMFTARAAKWTTILIISITFAATVTLLFGTVMKIPLP